MIRGELTKMAKLNEEKLKDLQKFYGELPKPLEKDKSEYLAAKYQEFRTKEHLLDEILPFNAAKVKKAFEDGKAPPIIRNDPNLAFRSRSKTKKKKMPKFVAEQVKLEPLGPFSGTISGSTRTKRVESETQITYNIIDEAPSWIEPRDGGDEDLTY